MHAINYKSNIIKYQHQLNVVSDTDSILLYEFKSKHEVNGCEFTHTLTAHLLLLKEKDRSPLFLAVEHVKPKDGTLRGMVYFVVQHKHDVIDLMYCRDFWNKLSVMQLSTQGKIMFKSLPPNVIKHKQNWNYLDIPVATILQDITTMQEVQEVQNQGASYANSVRTGMKV